MDGTARRSDAQARGDLACPASPEGAARLERSSGPAAPGTQLSLWKAFLTAPVACTRWRVIKVSGACTLSKEPYPFSDTWDPLVRVFNAWASSAACGARDWTRAFAVVNYERAIEPFLKHERPLRVALSRLPAAARMTVIGANETSASRTGNR
jgi:hypothetical protein